MTSKADTYNYAQNPLSGNYATITAAGLKSTTSGANGTSFSVQDNVTAWSTSNYTFANDQTSALTHTTLGNFDWPGVGVRLTTTGGGQGYILYLLPESSAALLFLLTGGTVGSGGNYVARWTGLTIVSGSVLQLAVAGTTLTAKYAGATLGTFNDSTYSSGQPGLAYQFGNSDASLITSWAGTDSSGGSNTGITPTIGAVATTGNQPNSYGATNNVIQTFVARRSGLLMPKERRIFLPSVRKAA